MDSSLQIDNIQSFIKVTGNNITPWRLLLGRDVIHVDGRRGKVFLINPVALQIGLELTTKKINNFKCQDNFTREICSTNDFNKIYPPILYEEKDGQGTNPTYAIKNFLKDEGYRFGKKAWRRTYPAHGFSVQELFSSATWLSRADKIEVRFYDDLEKILAVYRVDRGQLTCVTDNIPKL